MGVIGRGAANLGDDVARAGARGAANLGDDATRAGARGLPGVAVEGAGAKAAAAGDHAAAVLGREVAHEESLFVDLAKDLGVDCLDLGLQLATPDEGEEEQAKVALPRAPAQRMKLELLAVRALDARGRVSKGGATATATGLGGACAAAQPCVIVLCDKAAAAGCEVAAESAFVSVRELRGEGPGLERAAHVELLRALGRGPHALTVSVGRLDRGATAHRVVWARPSTQPAGGVGRAQAR